MREVRTRLTPGDRLPDIILDGNDGGPPVELRRRGRRAPVVVVVHGPTCDSCRDFVSELADRAPALREWDGRIVILSIDPSDGRDFAIPSDFRSCIAAEAEAWERLGVDGPAVLIADQWGEIFAVEPVGADHGFIEPSEVVEWLRYLAIQCPECQGEAE